MLSIVLEKVEKIISSGNKYVTLSRRGKLIVAKVESGVERKLQ